MMDVCAALLESKVAILRAEVDRMAASEEVGAGWFLVSSVFVLLWGTYSLGFPGGGGKGLTPFLWYGCVMVMGALNLCDLLWCQRFASF